MPDQASSLPAWSTRHRVRWAAWFGGAIGALTVVAFGGYIRYTTADALLFSLMSTRRLTVLYWGQDRLANLMPALVSPVRHEVVNFSVQMTLMASLFFGLLALLCRLHAARTGRAISAPMLAGATLVAGVVSMGVMRGRIGYWFVFEQYYAAALLAYLLGLVGLARGRPITVVVGGAAIVAACLVNPSIVLAAPFAWFFAPTQRRWTFLASVAAVSFVGVVITTAVSERFRSGPSYGDRYRDFGFGRMLDGLEPSISNVLASIRIFPTLVLLLAAIATLGRLARRRPEVVAPHLAAVAFGGGWLIVFAGNRWVEMSAHASRYFFPLYAAGLLLVCGAAVEWMHGLERRSGDAPRFARVIAACVVVVGVSGLMRLAVDGGIPVLDQARVDAAVAEEHDARIVVGDYWRVWPMVVASEADGRRLFPITFRSQTIDDQTIDHLASLAGDEMTVLCVEIERVACVAEVERVSGAIWNAVDGDGDGELSAMTLRR